jgi:hypothetical protein
MGAYDMLKRAHGITLTSAHIDFIQRVQLDKPQPPVESVPYDLPTAAKQALWTIKRIKRDIAAFRKTGDIEAIPANPMSELCTARFCTARNTSFCKSWIEKKSNVKEKTGLGAWE